MSRCESCPLDREGIPYHVACPAEWDRKSYCKHAAWEFYREPNGYWTTKILAKVGKQPPPIADNFPTHFPPPKLPGGKIRVGILTPSAYLGGAERCIGDYLDRCDPEQIEWTGIAIAEDKRIIPHIPIIMDDWQEHCPVAAGPAAVTSLAMRSDVLISWGISTDRLKPVLPFGVPLIQVSHCAFDEPHAYETCGYPGSTLVAVSKSALKGIRPDRRAEARIIHNAVDPARVKWTRTRAETFAEWGLPRGAKVAGWLARISPEKNPKRFVDAVACLPDGWHGVMVGTGLAEADVKSYAARVATDRIVFVGPSNAIGNPLVAFHAFVLPSASEGCCIALIEAWMASCPAIGTPVGMLEELPDLARILPANPTGQQIADAILADDADPDGRSWRVRRAWEYARNHLGPVPFGRAWTDLIREMAARPRHRSGVDPRVRELVNECEHRGSEGGLKLLESEMNCCGSGDERTACRAGKGKNPGRVTLRECLFCQGG